MKRKTFRSRKFVHKARHVVEKSVMLRRLIYKPMGLLVFEYPKPVAKQGTNMAVGTVATLTPLANRPFALCQ